MEREYEMEEEKLLLSTVSHSQLQKKGMALLNLTMSSARSGLGGKNILEFSHFQLPILPANIFKVGDLVAILPSSSESVDLKLTGIVYRISEKSISVACKDEYFECERYKIIKLTNNVSFERMNWAIKAITLNHPLASIIFDISVPSLEYSNLVYDFKPSLFYNNNLNQVQKEAVYLSLNSHYVSLIHGPPGTGKTMTIVEIIQQLINPMIPPFSSSKRGNLKILVCGPSNISIDNIIERLAVCNSKLKMVRNGHPARVLESVLKYSLDVVTRNSDSAKITNDIRKEIDFLLANLKKKMSFGERKEKWQELKDLRKDLKIRESKLTEQIISESQIVLSTLNGCGSKNLRKCKFDVVIIDEASQALEAECWIAVHLASKVILAGDHLQLPPTVKCLDAAKLGLEKTMFARLMKKFPDKSTMLTIQYRMHQDIMEFSSKELYQSKLIAHESVKQHLLIDFSYVNSADETTTALMLIDTIGTGKQETIAEDEESKFNQGEADLVVSHTEMLIKSGVKPNQIAIITPYNAQVAIIQNELKEKYPQIEIGSVDGFQGREKEAIVISLVRSNDDKEIGFLTEVRRTNVAITRARRHCCLICDSETVSSFPFFEKLIDHFMEKGTVVYK